eukprot:350730-Chlamydomonas_euryale.AAC.5
MLLAPLAAASAAGACRVRSVAACMPLPRFRDGRARIRLIASSSASRAIAAMYNASGATPVPLPPLSSASTMDVAAGPANHRAVGGSYTAAASVGRAARRRPERRSLGCCLAYCCRPYRSWSYCCSAYCTVPDVLAETAEPEKLGSPYKRGWWKAGGRGREGEAWAGTGWAAIQVADCSCMEICPRRRACACVYSLHAHAYTVCMCTRAALAWRMPGITSHDMQIARHGIALHAKIWHCMKLHGTA